jgi:hypothetical protein
VSLARVEGVLGFLEEKSRSSFLPVHNCKSATISTYKFFQKLLGNNHDVESLSFDEVFFFLVFTHFQWKK